MKKILCITMTVFFFLMAGCATTETTEKRLDVSLQSGNSSVNTTFVSSMGCNDQSCTDASHHHDCPADCTDYDHYHNCALDCSETQHHHSQNHHQNTNPIESSEVPAASFVSGMGCNDQNCTDASHHHDCPADCTDYDHYHNCALDCHETSHHHGGETAVEGHGKHHGNNHH